MARLAARRSIGHCETNGNRQRGSRKTRHERDLFDFYDATLWMPCFAVVELNIFHFEDQIPLADA
jgi:hypothetical protein